MFKRNSAFFQLSRQVAEDFLQSAVIVDDRAFGESPNGERPGKLAPPLTRSRKPPEDKPEEQSTDDSSADTDAAHRFNAKAVF